MRRFAAFVLISTAIPAAAQQADRGDGPWVNAHYVQASGMTMDVTIPFQAYTLSTSSGSGGGFAIGYGFFPWLSAYTNVDVAGGQTITATGATIVGDQTLTQMDAGVRLQLPLHAVHLTPYGMLGYSSRLLSGDVSVSPSGPGTLSEWGGAFTYGAGVQWFFARHFAVDVSYAWSQGTYSNIEVSNGGKFDPQASSVTTTRLQAGATWRAGPMAPPPASMQPNKDTLAIGQEVRVRAGNKIMTGAVILVSRDTVILQRMEKDASVQSMIPRACIVSAHQRLPEGSITPKLVTGGVLGVIAGGFIGVYANSTSSNVPQKAGKFVSENMLIGGLLGMGAGALVHQLQGDEWVALRTPEAPPVSFETRNELCAAWN